MKRIGPVLIVFTMTILLFQNCGKPITTSSIPLSLPPPSANPDLPNLAREFKREDFIFSEQKLKVDRNVIKSHFTKSCYCIECNREETQKAIELGCKAIHWGSFGWVEFSNIRGPQSGGSKQIVRSSYDEFFKDLSQRTALAKSNQVLFTAAIPEIVSDQITLLELTDQEIDHLNFLTSIYAIDANGNLRFPLLDKNSPADKNLFSNFENVVAWTDPKGETSVFGEGKPTQLFRWWGPDNNFVAKGYYYSGIPNLQTREGWNYHLWMAIKNIQAGASSLKLTQANIRFHAGLAGGSTADKEKIIIQFIKAARAYSFAINNTYIPFSTESVFGFSKEILPYIDFVKHMADTDLAHNGLVLTMQNSTQNCIQKNYAMGTVDNTNDFRTGPICLVDNGNSPSVRPWNPHVGPNPNFQIYTGEDNEEYKVAYSIELDGCQACSFNSNPSSGLTVPYYKSHGTSGDTVCSSYIRNGLSTTQQLIGQPASVRQNFYRYIEKATKQLSEKYGRTIFFPQLIKVDQNLTKMLDIYLSNSSSLLNYQKQRVRYCPRSITDTGITSGTNYENAIYSATECGDDLMVSQVLKSSAYTTRKSQEFVIQAYQYLLLRAPESQADISYHMNTCKISNLGTWVGNFLISPESISKLTSRHQVAAAMYKLFLLRDAQPQDIDWWATQFEPASPETTWRQSIALAFSNSVEFRQMHLILGCEI